jgi:hypothetical protein
MIQKQTEDSIGKIRITWKSAKTNNTYVFKFNSQPSIETLEHLSDVQDYEFYLNSLETFDVIKNEHKLLVQQVLDAVLASDNVTLESYNLYLDNLSWGDKITVQFYMNHIVSLLYPKDTLNLENDTEEAALTNIVNYIKSKSLRELQHILKL